MLAQREKNVLVVFRVKKREKNSIQPHTPTSPTLSPPLSLGSRPQSEGGVGWGFAMGGLHRKILWGKLPKTTSTISWHNQSLDHRIPGWIQSHQQGSTNLRRLSTTCFSSLVVSSFCESNAKSAERVTVSCFDISVSFNQSLPLANQRSKFIGRQNDPIKICQTILSVDIFNS